MASVWTVSELNRYVRQSLEKDYRLKGAAVTGEISGFKAYPSGHWYFTLKDEAAQVSCVMWRSRAEVQRLRHLPREGDKVEAHGDITLYEARGQFQFDVSWLEPTGAGDLYREFMALKAKLEAEGLFAPERKRPLPRRPYTIGIVTSPAGAALRDMLNVLRRRLPLARVILSPTAVQGPQAPAQIIAALRAVAAWAPEVIIVARGGGSLEDLWAFNDAAVARAIAAAPVPVISGVGHETDFTLADFAADLRAPTPSAAAELVSPVPVEELRAAAGRLRQRLAEAATSVTREKRWALAECQARLKGLSPQAQVSRARQRIDDATARLAAAMTHRLALDRGRWHGLGLALTGVSPLAVLQRGYAIVSRSDGTVVRRTTDVTTGAPLRVRVSNGEFGVRVSETFPEPPLDSKPPSNEEQHA
jgi:exodeoxyribonuclease VII large subunit